MRSHTACGRETGNAESVHGSTAIQQDHILPVGGQRMGDTESVSGSAAIQQDHVHAVVRRWEIQG